MHTPKTEFLIIKCVICVRYMYVKIMKQNSQF